MPFTGDFSESVELLKSHVNEACLLLYHVHCIIDQSGKAMFMLKDSSRIMITW